MAARALVVRELLLQEARRIGLNPEPITDGDGCRESDDEALVRALVAREIVTPEADEETCRRYFDRNRQMFRSSPLYAVRHILLAADPKDAAARGRARDLATSIVRELDRDASRFSDLAVAHSACPSRTVGGSLGQISRGETVPEFERALDAMTPGALAHEPVETRFGLHVVFLDQRIDGEALPYEAVKARIAHWLVERARLTAIRRYIALLAGRAEIVGIDLDPREGPMPQ
ncbi:MAG: peptidylprolyl isomerase [Hyphomicrobiaceae bacterium]